MIDPFETRAPEVTGPVENAAPVVPSNDADLEHLTRCFWVGGAGSLKVTMKGGQVVTFPNLHVGWHPIRATRVYAAGTSATSIVAAW